MLRIGLISDTHGLLRPEALSFLQGSDHIVHAGDICETEILEELAAIAPVTTVRGNNDIGPWARKLRETEQLKLGALRLYVLHDIAHLDIDPAAEGIHVVVFGHSHKPHIVQSNGVLFINPGAAGPRRFRLPVSVGEIFVDGDKVSARTVDLEDAGPLLPCVDIALE